MQPYPMIQVDSTFSTAMCPYNLYFQAKCMQLLMHENILRDLVADQNLEDFLACIPEQQVYPIDENHESRNNKNSTDTEISQTPDTVDEFNAFEVIMREVIKSTRHQLYDAVTNRQL